jgi:hypothetical protein
MLTEAPGMTRTRQFEYWKKTAIDCNGARFTLMPWIFELLEHNLLNLCQNLWQGTSNVHRFGRPLYLYQYLQLILNVEQDHWNAENM